MVLKVNNFHCFHASLVEGGSLFCLWCLFPTNYFLNVLDSSFFFFFALICFRVILPFCLLNFINFYLGGLKSFLSVEMSFHYLES